MARQYQPRHASPLSLSMPALILAFVICAALIGATSTFLLRRGQSADFRPASQTDSAPAPTAQPRQADAAPVAVQFVVESAPAPPLAGLGFVEHLPGEGPLAGIGTYPPGTESFADSATSAPPVAGSGFVEHLPGESSPTDIPAAAGTGLGFQEYLTGERPNVAAPPKRVESGVGLREYLEGEEPGGRLSPTPAEREPAPLIGPQP